MAGERTVPGTIGILTGWSLGSAYKDDMDENLLRLGIFTQLVADTFEESVPSDSPGDGAIRIVTGSTDTGHVYVRDDGAWIDYAPVEGMLAYVTDEDQHYKFDGSAWVRLVPEPTETAISLADETADFNVADADLDGRTIKTCDSSNSITVTVPSGLTGTEPLTIVRMGTGELSVTEGSGVTINSADGNLSARAQYSSMTLIPLGADEFLLIGDIAE